MKKNNNKGFMLLETMVVSAFIITTLTFLYVQFSNLKNSYDESFMYDSIPELFKTKEIDKFINENYGYADILSDVKESNYKYIEVYDGTMCNLTYFSKYNIDCNRLMKDMNVKTVLLVSTDLSSTINKFKTNNPYTNGLYRYIKKINQQTNNYSYSLIVEFNDKKYTNLIVKEDKVIVTFDANGGSVSTTSKEVKPGEVYGTLPTPTRSGYTFKGWNGKNLLNYNELLNPATIRGYSVDSNGNISGSGGNDYRGWNYDSSNWKFNLPSGNYTILLYFSVPITNAYAGLNLIDENNNIVASKGVSYLNNKSLCNIDFTLTNNTNLGLLIKSYDSVYKIIVKEQNDSFYWEPYYITKDTKVVQEQDHTLTAIWEANS